MTTNKTGKVKKTMNFQAFLLGLMIMVAGIAFLFTKGLPIGELLILPQFGFVIIALGFGIFWMTFNRRFE